MSIFCTPPNPSVLDIVSRLGTIIGLFFVILQIHLHRTQLKYANFLAVMQGRAKITEREIANSKLLRIYDENLRVPNVENLSDWNRLTDDLKALVLHLATVISAQECAFALLPKRTSQKDLEAELTALKEVIQLPLFQQTWPYLRTFYNEQFAQFVDSLL